MAAGNSDADKMRNSTSPAPQQQRDSEGRARSVSEDGSTGSEDGEYGATASRTPVAAVPDTDPSQSQEEAPPLPDEAPPEDDGWDCLWDSSAMAYYFHNRFTQVSQWENPRVPEATAVSHASYDRYVQSAAPGTTSSLGAPGTFAPGTYAPGTSAPGTSAPGTSSPPKRVAGGYNPAIHGSYDPNADYAQEALKEEEEEAARAAETATALAAGLPDPNAGYVATGTFNRFTGRFQDASLNPENHNDENKSKRQMAAFFDVDAAANSHDGRSLKAERRSKNLSKKELKAYKEKRRERKEEKRRAWLRD